MKGETKRFRLWASGVTSEYARRIIREYALCGSKRKVERDNQLIINPNWNWLSGCYVDMCAYQIGENEIMAKEALKWFRQKWPELGGRYK